MTLARAALPAVALVLCLGACVSNGRGDATDRSHDVVVERTYPERVHYCEPGDTTNVYYFDERRPDVVIRRRVYREGGGQTYYIERERDTDRRYYYDENAARSRGPSKGHGSRAEERDWDRGRGTVLDGR